MKFFDLFRKHEGSAARTRIERGFRGEGIRYCANGKTIELDFTWGNGDRLYTESISRWNSGEQLLPNEKANLFVEVLKFLSSPLQRTIVVINPDEASAELWETLSAEHAGLIEKIEYWSTSDQRSFERNMYIEDLKTQGTLCINDIEIRDEKELDEALESLNQRKLHSS